MPRNERVAPAVVALFLVVAVAFSGAARADAHDSIHRVVELWLAGKGDEAREAVERSLRHGDLDAGSRAVLHNLSARITRLQARQMAGSLPRLKMLSEAEYKAALAVRSAPMNALFWRDHLSIAIEARGRAAVEGALMKPWRYHGDRVIHVFHTAEYQVIARATLQVLDGRSRTAVTQLRQFLTERPGDDCATRSVLSQILHEVGQVDDAVRTLARASDTCRQLSFVASVESALHEAKQAQITGEAEAVGYAGGAYYMTVEAAEAGADAHRADLQNVVLQDPARLDHWFTLWTLLHRSPDRVDEYRKVVGLARRVAPSVHVEIANMYGQIGRGEFRDALAMATRLLPRHDHPHVRAVRLLAGAALGNGKAAHVVDIEVVRRESAIASILRDEQVEYCLQGDSNCVRGAVVRSQSNVFSAAAYRRGWQIRWPEDGQVYSDWLRAEQTAERLDGMARLRTEMQADFSDLRVQIGAVQARVDLILQPKLAELEARVTKGEIRQDQLNREIEQARARTNRELQQLAQRVEQSITIMDRQSTLTREQVRALSWRVAANSRAMATVDVDQFVEIFEQYVRTHPKEAALVWSTIVGHLNAAKPSDSDVSVMVGAIKAECNQPNNLVPCSRAVIRIVRKHLDLQIPLIPAVLSLDVLGVSDSLLELLDYLTRELGFVPQRPPKRRS